MNSNSLTIRPFYPHDQDAARRLILDGLAEHWGVLDLTLNRDLDDIAASYAHGTFLVAERNGRLLATGAHVPEADGVARVVRMSVARRCRRQGIGRLLLDALCETAVQQGVHRLVLETTSNWRAAVAFYQSYGFTATGVVDGDTYFALNLPIAYYSA